MSINGYTHTFSEALECIKHGGKAARTGWNGKGMHITMRQGTAPHNRLYRGSIIDGIETTHWRDGEEYPLFMDGDTEAVVMPCIAMRTATGATVLGWLASQEDMLAHDWELFIPSRIQPPTRAPTSAPVRPDASHVAPDVPAATPLPVLPT